MKFLTSISPNHPNKSHQKESVDSWLDKGEVYSVNSQEEIDKLSIEFPNVIFSVNPLAEENKLRYGRPYTNITTLFNLAKSLKDDIFCFINSDILISTNDLVWKNIEYITRGTDLFIAQRYNYKENTFDQATKENFGIDVFIMRKPLLNQFPVYADFLMGQCWWDYWVPYFALTKKYKIHTTNSPIFYHREHTLQWSQSSWEVASKWFLNFFGINYQINDIGFFSVGILNQLKAHLTKHDFSEKFADIHTFIKHLHPEIIFELGAHKGEDTIELSRSGKVTTFEPDPRNFDFLSKRLKNIKLENLAISSSKGTADFYLSDVNTLVTDNWSQSSSLKKPKEHLTLYPSVKFKEESVKVKTTDLDSYCNENNISSINLLWMDIQGNEYEGLLGAQKILRNTGYIYMEYSDKEVYAGQKTFDQILPLLSEFDKGLLFVQYDFLPDNYPDICIVKNYNILLVNKRLRESFSDKLVSYFSGPLKSKPVSQEGLFKSHRIIHTPTNRKTVKF